MDTWYEILVEASRAELEELLAATAAGGHGRPPCDRDLELDPLSLSDRVRDLLGGDVHHLVFATAPQARALLRAAQERGLSVDGVRRIEESRFTFAAEAFSEESAAEIRRALREDVPPEAAIQELDESDERDPTAKGVEMFAPAHDYVYRARGAVVGSPRGVLEMYRRLEELDFVEVGRLEVSGPSVELAEIAAPGEQPS